MPASPLARNDPDDVARTLTDFINATIMARGRPIGPDDPLEGAGVDSVAMLRVLLFIEKAFGFWIPDEDLVAEHIATARALARYICRHAPAA